jgi:hypothetical protein
VGKFGFYMSFSQLLLQTRVQLRAALCGIDVHSFSSEKERTKKADQGVPPWDPNERANGATLSLRSYLREVLHIQTLRSHFKEKCEHERYTHAATARTFAKCDAPCDRLKFKQDGKQELLLSLPAARGGFVASDAQKL